MNAFDAAVDKVVIHFQRSEGCTYCRVRVTERTQITTKRRSVTCGRCIRLLKTHADMSVTPGGYAKMIDDDHDYRINQGCIGLDVWLHYIGANGGNLTAAVRDDALLGHLGWIKHEELRHLQPALAAMIKAMKEAVKERGRSQTYNCVDATLTGVDYER